jgi:hypothetical protein
MGQIRRRALRGASFVGMEIHSAGWPGRRPPRSGEQRLVGWERLELSTNALKGHCSTN